MIPVEHRFANATLNAPAGKEAEILPLAVYTDGEQCISCWRMTWRERLSALLFGRVWLSVLSGRTQPPVWIWVTREALKDKEETKKVVRILWALPGILHEAIYRATGYVVVQHRNENDQVIAYRWRKWRKNNG